MLGRAPFAKCGWKLAEAHDVNSATATVTSMRWAAAKLALLVVVVVQV